MAKKLSLGFAVAAFLLFLFADAASGTPAIGVKPGDWIEYNVVTTGNPPEEHNVTWAKLEVLRVQSAEVDVNVTTTARNGTVSSLVMTLNLETGQIGAWWIIPANFNVGDTFYDAFLNQTVTISGEEQLEYAGATRTITNATIPDVRTKRWDKVTGAFVLSMDTLPDYTINVNAYRTNIWGQPVTGCVDATAFYVVGLGTITIIVIVVVLMVTRGRKTKNAPTK
jgi:hypothetical protein